MQHLLHIVFPAVIGCIAFHRMERYIAGLTVGPCFFSLPSPITDPTSAGGILSSGCGWKLLQLVPSNASFQPAGRIPTTRPLCPLPGRLRHLICHPAHLLLRVGPCLSHTSDERHKYRALSPRMLRPVNDKGVEKTYLK